MDEIAAYANALRGGEPISPQQGKYYWPQQDDIELSKKYDTTYGSPHAPYANPGNAYVKTATYPAVQNWFRQASAGQDQGPDVTRELATQQDADRNRALAIAVERSAMAKLGWDPGQDVSTPPGDKGLTINGMFSPPSNASWYDQRTPNAAMHEAMHRSMHKLRTAGKLPKEVTAGGEEEKYVRALMQRGYGNIEIAKDLERWGRLNPKSGGYKDLQEGIRLKNHPLVDELERIAAEEIARRRPRGPR